MSHKSWEKFHLHFLPIAIGTYSYFHSYFPFLSFASNLTSFKADYIVNLSKVCILPLEQKRIHQ